MSTEIQEYLQERSQEPYPFLVVATPDLLNYVFCDFYVISNTESDTSTQLDSITFNSSSDIDIVLKRGSVLFDSTLGTIIKSIGSGTTYRSFEYVDTATSTIVKFIIDVAKFNELVTPPVTYSGLNLTVVNRNIETNPKSVTKLHTLLDELNLRSGYNTKLTTITGSAIDTNYKHRTQIKIDLSPGYGLGKYDASALCTSATTDLKTFNGTGPDSYGNFIFYPNNCYWYEMEPNTHSITMRNDCVACFDCVDVVSTYDSLKTIYANAKALRLAFKTAVDKYNVYVNDINELQAAISTTAVTPRITQTDFTAFDIVFRLQTGSKAIKKVTITVSYGPGAVTATLQPYSGYYKLPSFASQSLPSLFNGTSTGYDSSSIPANTKLQANTYAYWYWNMHFERSDTATAVNITYTVTCEFVDGSPNYVLGPTTETVNFVIVP